MTNMLPSVMVIEDDTTIRETLAEALGDEGWSVVAAANGMEAWDLLRGGAPPAVIVLDVMMPLMDGVEFMELLRRDSLRSSIPVIQISAGMQLAIPGVAARLDKPFLIDSLLHLMTAVASVPAEPALRAAARR